MGNWREQRWAGQPGRRPIRPVAGYHGRDGYPQLRATDVRYWPPTRVTRRGIAVGTYAVTGTATGETG